LNKARVSLEEFFHIDVNYDLVSLGFDKFAAIKDTIIHLSGDNLFSFLKKRLRFMRIYHQDEYNLRRYRVYEPQDKWKLLVFILYGLTFVKPLFDSSRGYLKIKDKAWFLHPLVCFTIIFVYGWGLISRLLKLNIKK
jgi:hypothetical protein